MLCCRGTRTCKRSTARCFSCCCRRRATEAPRQIQDHGVSRALDPDSESEAEVVSDPCEAVLVGLELQGKPRALAPEGCEDRAASEPTRLLESDLQLSDLSGKECARLCNHHSQLYMLSCQGRKCSVVSRFCKVHGAHRGTPLCKKHLSETGRAQSPSPPPKSTGPKPEEPSILSVDPSLLTSGRIPEPVGWCGLQSKALLPHFHLSPLPLLSLSRPPKQSAPPIPNREPLC